MSVPIDPAVMLLRSFRLPTMAKQYEEVMQRAEKEGWSHREVMRHLCESEAIDRAERRTVRLLAESGLPETKTLSTLDESLLSAKVRRQLPALIEGSFVERSVNVLAFGLPGRGKTHFLAALGRELILRHSKRVLFRPAFKLVGQLLAAKRDLRLEQELKKLDRFDVLILDDIGYVQQSREEMEVLFTLLAERYERRSLLISSNLVFSQWDQIFHDPMTTMAAIDRLVHHSIILEFDGVSQRVKKAGESAKKQAVG
jgi:DNA replication protein DnaC